MIDIEQEIQNVLIDYDFDKSAPGTFEFIEATKKLVKLFKKVSRLDAEVKPANAEREIFEYIEGLLEGGICDREDAIKNGCGRCRKYWNYRDKRLSV